MNEFIRIGLRPLVGLVTMFVGVLLVLAIRLLSFAEPAISSHSQVEQTAVPFRQETELSCYDMNILPIWREIKSDNDFRQRMIGATGFHDCSELLQVKTIDLNQDGIDEFLVRGKGAVLCGGLGNCNYWILAIERGEVRTLLSAAHLADQYEFAVDEVQKIRSKGYPEFLFASYDSQHVMHFQTYRFDGTKYSESRCMSEVPKSLRDGAGSWELVTCEEFSRQRDEIREWQKQHPN